MKVLNAVHPDLILAQKFAYEPMGLSYKKLVIEKESQKYGACEFSLYNHIIKFRVAKITPTKIGQFVTFWKRIGSRPILPYDVDDLFDFLIISVRTNNRLGQFIFPKSLLFKHGIISKNGNGGKRAIRVYLPWDVPTSSQARKSQTWQNDYFFEIPSKISAFDRLKGLLRG